MLKIKWIIFRLTQNDKNKITYSDKWMYTLFNLNKNHVQKLITLLNTQ